MQCTGSGQLHNCYNMLFPKVNNICVHSSTDVPCNTSLSENYVAHSYVTVVCVIGWIWEKN